MLTYTKDTKHNTSDALSELSDKLFRKMTKFNKFIIPLALVKIILVFVVLQLFFSSCEQDAFLYRSDLYTEGPLFEIEASLGTNVMSFESNKEGNAMIAGDTVYLEIALESTTLYDEIAMVEIPLQSPEFHCHFIITDADGAPVFPPYFEVSGDVDSVSNEAFFASFGESAPEDILMSPSRGGAINLKIGFVIEASQAYTFHFVNTPNNFTSAGGVDILYNRNPENAKDVEKAYAVYLFDLGHRSEDYANTGASFKQDILSDAGVDQAIIDFTVTEKN